jgi:tetratricopeptide (TPR) repeat protein
MRSLSCAKILSLLALLSTLSIGCASLTSEPPVTKTQSASQAMQKLRAGDLKGALDSYNKAINQNPKEADLYVNRGIALDELGQHKAAIADYTKALDLKPDQILAYYNRANAHQQLKENDQAIADYTKIITLDPKYPYAYANRGVTYFGMGKEKEAITDLQKAAEIFESKNDPKNVQRVQQLLAKWTEKSAPRN